MLLWVDPRADLNWPACNPDTGDFTSTPLMMSILNSNMRAVELLLTDHRVEVNWKNDEGKAAIHLMADPGIKTEIAEFMIAHPEVNVNSGTGELMLVHDEFAGWMIKEQRPDEGKTVLHLAASSGNVEVVKLVLAEPGLSLIHI